MWDMKRKKLRSKNTISSAQSRSRKAVAAKPDDFQERIWLARILAATGRQGEAETELRKAVALAPNDPARWIILTDFLVFTAKQPQEAEKVIEEAKLKLSASLKPMALAECCEMMGRAYENGPAKADVKKWYDAARKWYEQAESAHDEDLWIKQRLTEFLLRSNQIGEAERYLDAIIQGGGGKSAKTAAWARRVRAEVYAAEPMAFRN